MNELWEYEPQNLVVTKLMRVNLEGKPVPLCVSYDAFPQDGYLVATCGSIWPRRQPTHAGFLPNCSCGIHGYLKMNYLSSSGREWNWQINVLAETHGTVVIGHKGIVRAEKMQVIAAIKEKGFELAADYFDIPVVEKDEAQNLIDQQMKVHRLARAFRADEELQQIRMRIGGPKTAMFVVDDIRAVELGDKNGIITVRDKGGTLTFAKIQELWKKIAG